MISIIELLTYCQFFILVVLEQYCIEKSQQFKVTQYQATMEYMYFPEAYQEDCMVLPNEYVKPVVEVSDIRGSKAEDLFSALQQELGSNENIELDAESNEDSLILYEDHMNRVNEDNTQDDFLLINELNILDQSDLPPLQQEDCLSLDDLIDSNEPMISSDYQAFATAKIADNIIGNQQWTVSVIGMEGSHIHVSDGRRVWVDLGEKARSINPKDILSIEVNKKEDGKIEVIRTIKLEEGTFVSDEYVIPDEEIYLDKERRVVC
ncbi:MULTISPECIES: hypothetical protein [Metabacillus]|uniref:hypothetical protein n=1 Tax=Metabacillus TaxID=2675233 RepID=UPI000C808C91|nr:MULTISPECIES: hypothetical protein [Metabacillus]MCM3443959.1 hypothetical protein [Metabacillus halosaccharovorans]PMC34989.1 hypothetical protein CJ195_21005 [Bacillus sp. UMB0899]